MIQTVAASLSTDAPNDEIRVFVVDDVDVLRDALRDMIDRTPGMLVAGTAEDGQTAIDTYSAVAPDVIIMDMKMPRMDGPTATQHITSRGTAPRILMLSAYADESLVTQAVEAGAWSFLLKDSAPTAILDAIRETANGKHCFSQELQQLRAVAGAINDGGTDR